MGTGSCRVWGEWSRGGARFGTRCVAVGGWSLDGWHGCRPLEGWSCCRVGGAFGFWKIEVSLQKGVDCLESAWMMADSSCLNQGALGSSAWS